MKILFTSDLHGLISAIESFSNQLARGDYNCGVIAGDIIDDGVSNDEIENFIDEGYFSPDDFLEQLPPSDSTFEEYAEKAIEELYNEDSSFMKAIHLKEKKVKYILNKTDKPIFIIPGNHDLTEWEDYKNIINIHNKSISFKGINFVGYRWTSLKRTKKDRKKDSKYITHLVNKNTILVTHDAPYGILDEGVIAKIGTKKHPHIGSKYIRKIVDKKKPLYHLFGHTHHSFGVYENFINGSYPTYRKFISIDTDNNTVKIISE